jgi:hypothetical protein
MINLISIADQNQRQTDQELKNLNQINQNLEEADLTFLDKEKINMEKV